MTLYRHFASKDELIAQYLRHFTELARSERPEPARRGRTYSMLRHTLERDFWIVIWRTSLWST
jgi:AcrR family transcriptional regulator